jgi:hypothetical protein
MARIEGGRSRYLIGTLFSFTRTVEASDQRWAETIEVFAPGPDVARSLLDAELEALRTSSPRDEVAFRESPEWTVRSVTLDEAKVVAIFLT